MFQNFPQIPKNSASPRQAEIDESPIMYGLASVGAIGLINFSLSFITKTPAPLGSMCAIAGGIGLVIHGVYCYGTAKARKALFWAAWLQSALLVALSFYIGGKLCP
jgi:hypothetical protein